MRFTMIALALVASFGSGAALGRTAGEQHVLRVGTSQTGSPWSFHDPNSNLERGLSIDIINAIGQDAGYIIQLVPKPRNGDLIPGLINYEFDVIAANLLITPERQARIAFSDPLSPGNDGLVVPASDTHEYGGIEDLKGWSIGAQDASPFVAPLRNSGLFPDLKIYPDSTDAMQAVANGEVRAAVVGEMGAAYDLYLGHFPTLRLVRSYRPLFNSVHALGARKEDRELLQTINACLAKMKMNGTMKAIFAGYGIAWRAEGPRLAAAPPSPQASPPAVTSSPTRELAVGSRRHILSLESSVGRRDALAPDSGPSGEHF